MTLSLAALRLSTSLKLASEANFLAMNIISGEMGPRCLRYSAQPARLVGGSNILAAYMDAVSLFRLCPCNSAWELRSSTFAPRTLTVSISYPGRSS